MIEVDLDPTTVHGRFEPRREQRRTRADQLMHIDPSVLRHIRVVRPIASLEPRQARAATLADDDAQAEAVTEVAVLVVRAVVLEVELHRHRFAPAAGGRIAE